MISAFCPAHITCFFEPVESTDILSRGSRGAGIRLSEGTRVSISENRSSRIEITMDSIPSEAPVTRKLLEMAAPGRGFDVIVDNCLPVGQGFGMSAAGAIAAALCVGEIEGFDDQEAYRFAHRAEVIMGGGLGDVSGIMGDTPQPVRVVPGLPPIGKVIGTGIDLGELSVVVLGSKVSTSNVLKDQSKYRSICEAGHLAVDEYMKAPSKSSLYSISNEFSSNAGLENNEVHKAINALKSMGIMSGMCMLGNSIFIDSRSKKIIDAIDGHEALKVTPTGMPASVIRKE